MITHPAAPDWFSCTLDAKHLPAIHAWMTEHQTNELSVHLMKTDKQVFVFFKDEALAAVFKLAFIDHILPE
jgi:hypothetical protein